MFKKVAICILIVLSIVSFSSYSYATDIVVTAKKNTKVDTSRYEILNPEKSSFSTENKVILINGKAPTGTVVTIDTYGTTDLTKKSFNLDKLPTDKDYIKILTEEVTSGNMGFFQREINLIMGVNKVIINFGVEDLLPVEIIIYVFDKVAAERSINNHRGLKISEILPMMN